jgi:hypothetical protein
MTPKLNEIVTKIETYIQDYVTLANPQYALPIALWVLGTYCFPEFDAYPYLTITAATKRSGKTRLGEMISFCCSNPRMFAALTGPTMFRCIQEEHPTIIFDESEGLSSEAAGTMRSVLNVGYRRGQTVPRSAGQGIKEYDTYCPKIFILIGDVYDTLRDRSIVIFMKRAETRKRFTFEAAKEEGKIIRELVSESVKQQIGAIMRTFQQHQGLSFLMDRDEEIWTSLFCLAEVFCKDRIQELQACAADMAAEKTGEAVKYTASKEAEAEATKDEYRKRMLADLWSLFMVDHVKAIRSEEVVDKLKAIPTAPWRKFKGVGITAHDVASMMEIFKLNPVRIALGSGRGNQKFYRGYKRADVEKAMKTV